MTSQPPVAPPAPPADPRRLLDFEEQQLLLIVSHASQSGVRTSEFWLPLVTPPVTFGLTAVVGWAVAHGLTTNAIADSAAPLAASAATTWLATWASRAYVAARTALKQSVLGHAATRLAALGK